MSQYNTNMKRSSYLAYCSAWCLVFTPTCKLDGAFYDQAVRAGIVFG